MGKNVAIFFKALPTIRGVGDPILEALTRMKPVCRLTNGDREVQIISSVSSSMTSDTHQNHPMFRLALLELTRAVEQTAILASLAMGSSHSIGRLAGGRPKQHLSTVRKALLPVLIHAINASLVEGVRIAHLDPFYRWKDEFPSRNGERGSLLVDDVAPLLQSEGLGQLRLMEGNPGLDLAIAPVEGIIPLISGQQGGSASILALGERGVFKTDQDHREDEQKRPRTDPDDPDASIGFTRYFVLVVRDEHEDCLSHAVESFQYKGPACPVEIDAKWEQRKKTIIGTLLDEIGRAADEQDSETEKPITLGTTCSDRSMTCHVPGKNVRVREFVGSPTSAVIAVADPRLTLDGYFGVVRSNAVFLMAAAARCLGLKIFAVPVFHRKKNKKLSVQFVPDGGVRREKDFVDPEQPVGLIATAITPHPAMHGIRFHPTGHVQTNTIVLNGLAKTVRRVRHDRCIESDSFYSIDKPHGPKSASEVIAEFRQQLE